MALTQEDIQAIGALLEPLRADIAELKTGQKTMQADISAIKEDIEQIKEDTAITRETTNSLGEWADAAADVLKIRYPIKE